MANRLGSTPPQESDLLGSGPGELETVSLINLARWCDSAALANAKKCVNARLTTNSSLFDSDAANETNEAKFSAASAALDSSRPAPALLHAYNKIIIIIIIAKSTRNN